MQNNEGRKTERAYWEAVSEKPIRYRVPSKFNVSVLNMTQLLQRYVKEGSRYIEIGCAPGKILAWAAQALKADVTGLDYSKEGIAKCCKLFEALELKGTFFHDDLFNHHMPLGSFDVVASFGVIEHFDDVRPAVQRHIDLVKPGGVALIAVPNYGGIYGKLQGWFDAPNLSLHNLEIMKPSALVALVKSPDVESAQSYPFGFMSPWIVNFDKRLPRFVAKLISLGVNALGLIQFFPVDIVSPMLVLEIRKK